MMEVKIPCVQLNTIVCLKGSPIQFYFTHKSPDRTFLFKHFQIEKLTTLITLNFCYIEGDWHTSCFGACKMEAVKCPGSKFMMYDICNYCKKIGKYFYQIIQVKSMILKLRLR